MHLIFTLVLTVTIGIHRPKLNPFNGKALHGF